jgi:hypothetical protein
MSYEMGKRIDANLPESPIKNEQARFFASRLRRYQELTRLPYMFPHESKLVRHLGMSTYRDLVHLGFKYLAEEILCNPIADNS